MNDTSCIILELEKISRFRAVDLSLVEHIEKLKKPIKQAKIKNRDLDTHCIKITVLIWWTQTPQIRTLSYRLGQLFDWPDRSLTDRM